MIGRYPLLFKKEIRLKCRRLETVKLCCDRVKVDLRCNYKLEGENMYSLKWYRDNVEFYRWQNTLGFIDDV